MHFYLLLFFALHFSMFANDVFELETGMTHDELSEMLQYIQSQQACWKEPLYLHKEVTGLPRTIEVDPDKGLVLIHLKKHNLPEVGHGRDKRVTRSLLLDTSCLDPSCSRLVATAILQAKDYEMQASILRELELLQKFRSLENIIQLIHHSEHLNKAGIRVFEMITPLYNKGSIASLSDNFQGALSTKAKVQIARDMFRGACQLHNIGYISRDNHSGNFFVHEEQGEYSACFGDLGGGWTLSIDDVLNGHGPKGGVPFGPHAPTCPPDLFRPYIDGERITFEQLLSYQVYSFGLTLYQLHYGEMVPWFKAFYERYPQLERFYRVAPEDYKIDKEPLYKALVQLQTAMNSFLQPRLEMLFEKKRQKAITADEEFELIILQTLSPSIEIRSSALHWIKELEQLLDAWN